MSDFRGYLFIDDRIEHGCNDILQKAEQQGKGTPNTNRAIVVAALQTCVDIAEDDKKLQNAYDELLKLAEYRRMDSIRGRVLILIRQTFWDVDQDGEGSIQSLMPDSIAQMERLVDRYMQQIKDNPEIIRLDMGLTGNCAPGTSWGNLTMPGAPATAGPASATNTGSRSQSMYHWQTQYMSILCAELTAPLANFVPDERNSR